MAASQKNQAHRGVGEPTRVHFERGPQSHSTSRPGESNKWSPKGEQKGIARSSTSGNCTPAPIASYPTAIFSSYDEYLKAGNDMADRIEKGEVLPRE